MSIQVVEVNDVREMLLERIQFTKDLRTELEALLSDCQFKIAQMEELYEKLATLAFADDQLRSISDLMQKVGDWKKQKDQIPF
jgi:hypothetical protein